MKVVIAALSAPAQLNGVSRHSINLARALLTMRNLTSVHFLAGEWQREMFHSAIAEMDSRLHSHWLPLPDVNVSRLFWYSRELPHIARQLDADVVHLTYPVPMNAKAYNCPTVLSLHDLYPFDIPENFGFWKSILARRTAKRCIRLVDAIACVSESTAASLGESFPAEAAKATIIPNVVQLAGPSATDCGLETLRGRTFILCVAQHRCNKNVPLTIRVFERALRKGFIPADSLLVVVGIGGPETKRIGAQIIQLRLEKKVLLVSGMTDPGLRWCYENCAVLLACSNAEGFGLPVAEGLLAGCRIVCSDIPAFREVGAVTCRFVSWGPDLIGRYAEAIRELLVLPKPSSTVLPRYSVGTVGQQYVDLYESLICSRLPGFDMLRQLDSVPRGANSMGSRPI